MTETIAVVDYGMGNLRSVAKALTHVAPKARVIISSSVQEINAADRVVFPGQGAARDCMRNLHEGELREVVAHAFHNKPFFGICMGLQVLFQRSAENDGIECMGLVDGQVDGFVRDPLRPEMKIPHMGWNRVQQCAEHPLWNKVVDGARFYFVHSYFVSPQNPQWIAGKTEYLSSFTSVVARDNVFATQFHPEKSASDGLQLLQNFVHWKLN